MLRSRSKPGLRLYLSGQHVLPENGPGLNAWEFQAETAEAGLIEWLTSHAPEAGSRALDIELAGELLFQFCLPFSSTMKSPHSVANIVRSYLQSTLGNKAPSHFRVAEPVRYGEPILVLALRGRAGFFSADTGQLRSIQSYGLATWNRQARQLPPTAHWLVVVEPGALTFFYSERHIIIEALTVVSGHPASPEEIIQRTLSLYFHRPGCNVFLVDEFGVLDGQCPDIERLVPLAGGFANAGNEAEA